MITLRDEELPEEQHRSKTLAQVCTSVGMVALLVYFITFSPFSDLSDQSLLSESVGNEVLVYLFVFCLVGIGATCLYLRQLAVAFLVQSTKYNFILLAWLCLTVVFSSDPGTSLRRLILTVCTFLIAAMLPWLVRGPRQFINLLTVIAFLVLYLSYSGIMLIPDLAIHHASDVVEPDLAGNWRGIYGHKNVTAEVMAIFVFVGWLISRMQRPFIGALISISAFVFLLFSGGKSAVGILFLVVIIAFTVVRAETLWVRAIAAFAPLLVLAFLTVGSVISDFARSILEHFPVDPTFTGRADVWRFAIEKLSARPITGYGFEAFWHSSEVLYGSEDPAEWAVSAHTSHNGYLDLALTIGLPGLFLTLITFLVIPLYNFHHTIQVAANRSLAQFFLTIWLFLIYMSLFEAFILSRVDQMWFMFAIATCGLNCTSKFIVSDDQSDTQPLQGSLSADQSI